jgi:hypothetical protein
MQDLCLSLQILILDIAVSGVKVLDHSTRLMVARTLSGLQFVCNDINNAHSYLRHTGTSQSSSIDRIGHQVQVDFDILIAFVPCCDPVFFTAHNHFTEVLPCEGLQPCGQPRHFRW